MKFPKVNQKQSFPEMETVFDAWNEEKKAVEKSERTQKIYFQENEVWWVSI